MKDFTKQLFGARTWQVVGSLTLFLLIGFFVRESVLALPLIVLIGLSTFALTCWRLKYGVMMAFVEIFAGGHGHWLVAEMGSFSVSLRMVLFAAVMAGWLVYLFRRKHVFTFTLNRDVPWLLLALAVGIGFLVGLDQNGFGSAFDDANGYVTIMYLLPLMSIRWTNVIKREWLQVLTGVAIWVAGFTIIGAYLFTHLDGDALNIIYTYIRDARLAEVTLQVYAQDSATAWQVWLYTAGLIGDPEYWYRIFMPAQTSVMVMWLVVYAAAMFLWRGQRLPLLVYGLLLVFLLVLLLSLSRSFFLALAVGAFVITVTSFFFGKKAWRVGPRRMIAMIGVLALSLTAIWALVMVPVPSRPDLQDAAFFSTSAETGRSEAVVSRWSLLTELQEEIALSPIIGSGFGSTVSYASEDPRVLEEYGDLYTTYRFEWGWHDMWLKMGLLGLLAFLLYGLLTGRDVVWAVKRESHRWLLVGLGAGVLALFVAHIFSPYLNHPIGLGYMLYLLPFLTFEKTNKQSSGKGGLRKMVPGVLQPAPLVREISAEGR